LPTLKGKKQGLYLPHREKKDYKTEEAAFLAMFPPHEKCVVLLNILPSWVFHTVKISISVHFILE
jgi:hypothetical protein